MPDDLTNRTTDNDLFDADFYNEWEGVRVAAEADIAEYEAWCDREGLDPRSPDVLEAWLLAGSEFPGGGTEGDADGDEGTSPTDDGAPPP